MEDLSEKITEFRAAHDLSQVEFARMCKVSELTIVNIEKKRARPTRLTIAKIKRVINE